MVIGQGHTCSVASLLEQDPARICAVVTASRDAVTAVTGSERMCLCNICGAHVQQCDYSLQAWRKYDSDRSGYIESNELKVRLSVPLSAIKQINETRFKVHSCSDGCAAVLKH